ncbi:GNAT family N-acetyltransferase [uncultured Muribaculum sp.]|uniref:GNAT family N-acetyltransferase n=1 Tax=uncultured Muribaculum sp. TaxID=1918613 RepID=UPI0025B75708|nr:GNAT family N-acetyltransferase [uncultured Muribaculum sp.]
MINLEKINTDSDLYPWSEKLWLDSFPEIERRDTVLQRLNTDTCPIFNYNVAISENRPVGLFTYWDFEKFIYCEHFATDKSLRGKGYGSEILKKVISKTCKPMVLEVEYPENETSRRRIEFYKRAGLRVWETQKYVQPPYRKGGEPLPLLLMATDGLDESSDFQKVMTTIHSNVYGVDM